MVDSCHVASQKRELACRAWRASPRAASPAWKSKNWPFTNRSTRLDLPAPMSPSRTWASERRVSALDATVLPAPTRGRAPRRGAQRAASSRRESVAAQRAGAVAAVKPQHGVGAAEDESRAPRRKRRVRRPPRASQLRPHTPAWPASPAREPRPSQGPGKLVSFALELHGRRRQASADRTPAGAGLATGCVPPAR